ncbi:FkbM family methyltransferase [Neobacillus ginsengisoli]|uniref:FkbM family methyltransferase n=1 Tax=Neobacillus ginsengisoli TaxID=904295 RepID=A0ABT9XZL2_9BACI|nr:FkbM family methyltransferase [Neobacillus ginsengisoli]MDQ0200367.1 FkbM family methyltransferase [Neobacillus ginsengisoli]
MKLKAAIRKPFLMRIWENYPKTWKFLIDLGILLKYKTLNVKKLPDKVILPCSNILFVNSEENRGRALLISNGITQKRLTYFWLKAVKEFKPDLVVDVGVNYGECIFSTIYPLNTKIYGIEANSHLLKYINRSKDVHPNKLQIKIINAIASDMDDEEKIFFIDKHWSGTSSAAYIPSHNFIEKVPIKSIAIDTLLSGDWSYEAVLFKVDVEGFEAFVLKGMTNLFKNSVSLLGFIEFNSEYIEKLGICVEDFLIFLKTHFTIYVYKKDDTLVKAVNLNYIDLQNLFGTNYIHTDFILVKDESIIEKLELTIQSL